MKRRKHRREIEENEDTKRGSHNPNQRETEEENNNDKLSDFPDCILLHILSFLNVIEAVRTCLLSTRWKHLWKHLPTLTFSFSNLNTRKGKGFTKFVTTFLSLRDSTTALNALDLKHRGCFPETRLLQRIVTYSVSHNVNRLHLDCPIQQFPLFLFSCQSLTSLALGYPSTRVIFPNSLNLPALTYLKLVYFSFCSGNDGKIEPFSTFSRLNTLILEKCTVPNEQTLCISSTTILDLSIHSSSVPQHRLNNIVLFAPSLCTFAFAGHPFHKLTGSHLSSIKQVSIDIGYQCCYSVETSFCILDWLREITDIKLLTVTPETLRALSINPDKLKLKLPFLSNMKSLLLNLSRDAHRFSSSSWRDIKMELAGGKSWKENAKLRELIKAGWVPIYSSILDGMIDFLLQNSPSAKLDIVKC